MSGHDSESSSAFSVGKGGRIGNISVGGNVAGRDVIITTTTTTSADAASASNMDQVLEILKTLQEQIASLDNAPAGLRDDAQDELRKAQQAGTSGDKERVAEKLGTAQGYLERIGQNLPAAIGLAQTVATLAVRVSGMG
jgi:hypothetical protein